MSTPSSREELKQYALRKLGAPVIEINVDDAQLEDALDDALQMFNEYHFDGAERALYKHKITQADINNGYLDTDSFGFTGPNDAVQPDDSKRIVHKGFSIRRRWCGIKYVQCEISNGFTRHLWS